jgi:serine protease Do
VQLEKLTPELVAKYGLNSGILVKDVLAGGPADKGGLASGDVITKLDGETIDSINRFRLAAKDLPPGRMVTVEYVRNGQTATATVELGIPPPSPVQHGFFGVQLGVLSPELAAKYGLGSGTLVTGVQAGGPADKAGLASGDVITKLDGQAVDNLNQFRLAAKDLPAGRMVTLEYIRNGQTATATVELGAHP